MREITLPEVKLPDIRLPEGLREMSRDDIVQAAHDVRSNVHMPRKIDMPDIDLSKVDLSKVDLSKIDLSKVNSRSRSATGCHAGDARIRCFRLPGSWPSER